MPKSSSMEGKLHLMTHLATFRIHLDQDNQ